MPTISVDPERLFRLVGRKFDEDVFTALGLELEALDDGTRRVEYNRNRPDMSGITGLSRALKGILEVELGVPKYNASEEVICTLNGRARGREAIAAAVVELEEPLNETEIVELIEMQETLCNTYGRKRELIAIGLHDFEKIKCPITYTNGSKDLLMIPLDQGSEKSLSRVLENTEQGKLYGHLGKSFPILVDSEGKIIAFPPVINSEITRLKPGVRKIFIDVTGIREDLVENALEIIVSNILEYGGKAYRMKVNGKIYPKLDVREIKVSPSDASSIAGVPISIDEFIEGLRKMRLDRREPYALIPSYRIDVMGPIDVIENALIGYGIDQIAEKAEMPESRGIGRRHAMSSFIETLRDLLIGLGFIEIIGPTLVNSSRYIEEMKLPATGYVLLENPISKEHNMLRAQILPVILRALRENRKSSYPQRIFEIGEIVKPSEDSLRRSLSLASSHAKASFSEIKGYVESILLALGIKASYENLEKPYYLPGRSARIVYNGIFIGELGELHPEVLKSFEILMPVAAAELNVSNLFKIIYEGEGQIKEDKDRF